MKQWVVFLLGLFVGVVLTFIVSLFVAANELMTIDSGVTFFEQPSECLSTNSEVMQVVDQNYALAYEQEYSKNYYRHTGLLVLVTNDTGDYYYDKQVIEVPEGKCMRQVGVYEYQTKSNDWITVPIVKLMDK